MTTDVVEDLLSGTPANEKAKPKVDVVSELLSGGDFKAEARRNREAAMQQRSANARDARIPAQDLPELTRMDLSEFDWEDDSTVTLSQGSARKAISTALFTTPDNEARKDIIRKVIPFVEFKKDSRGDEVVVLPDGRRAFINKPGLSPQDVDDFVADIIKFAPSAAGAIKLPGTLLKMAGGAFGGGVTSIAEDIAAMAQGSEQSIDIPRAATTGALIAGGEAVAPIAASAGAAIGRQAQKILPTAAREGMEELPVDVPLSLGDRTRDVRQQGLEDSLLKGAGGDRAQQVMQAFRETQQGALKDTVPAIQSRLTGQAAREPLEGIESITDTLMRQYEADNAKVTALYDAAREGKPAFIPATAVRDFGKQIRKDIVRGYDLADMGNVKSLLRQFDEVSDMPGRTVTAVKIKAMEMWRRRVTKAADGKRKSEPSQSEALRVMRDAYDAFLEDSLNTALVIGDEQTIRAWRRARSARKELGQKFESNKIIESFAKDGLAPEQALSALFNAEKFGLKKDGLEALQKLKAGLPEVDFNALREEAFLKLMRSQLKGPRGKDKTPLFSGTKFATALEGALQDNPTAMRTLFSSDEIKLLNKFKDVSLSATNRVQGAIANSNTPNVLIRLTDQLLGPSMSNYIRNYLLKGAREAHAEAQAKRATAPLLKGGREQLNRLLELTAGPAGVASARSTGAPGAR